MTEKTYKCPKTGAKFSFGSASEWDVEKYYCTSCRATLIWGWTGEITPTDAGKAHGVSSREDLRAIK